MSGEPQPFETVERYSERLVRRRFDRRLLLQYLDAVGIRAHDRGFYGDGALVVESVDYKPLQQTAQQVRSELGW